jgi:hypothetical integral membrane protein (TIGR02206 family)
MDHLIYLLLFTAALASLILNRDRIRANRKWYSYGTLVLSILQQVLLYSWYFLEMGFDLSESLPLHICRIASLLGIWYLLTKRSKVMDTMFYFGLYAYGSFLYPQRIYPVYHVIGISFIINHIITILLPWFAFIAYDWRPDFRGLIRSSVWFLIYFTFVYFLNPLIDGNYFYLKYRPFFQDWPDIIYVPFVLAFTLCSFAVAYFIARQISVMPWKTDNSA